MYWTTSGGLLEHVVEWIAMCNGSNKMEQLHIQPISHWSGLTIDFLIGWSAGAMNPGRVFAFIQLNSSYSYIWGLLKDNVYENNVVINQKICAIPERECIRMIDNFAWGIQVCHQCNGGNLEYTLYENASFKLTTSN